MIKRWLRHLCSGQWQVRRAFPAMALQNIETAIRGGESPHHGEIRFAVEAGLDMLSLLKNQSARERALEVFSYLRVWDTELNNGVLIYVLLAERDVEIVADRGIHAQVGVDTWEKICSEMESLFRSGRFEDGVLAGISSVSSHLSRYYPKQVSDPNELPDAPVLL